MLRVLCGRGEGGRVRVRHRCGRVRVRVGVRVCVRVGVRREALGAPSLAADLLLATPLRAPIREPHLKVGSG